MLFRVRCPHPSEFAVAGLIGFIRQVLTVMDIKFVKHNEAVLPCHAIQLSVPSSWKYRSEGGTSSANDVPFGPSCLLTSSVGPNETSLEANNGTERTTGHG